MFGFMIGLSDILQTVHPVMSILPLEEPRDSFTERSNNSFSMRTFHFCISQDMFYLTKLEIGIPNSIQKSTAPICPDE